ncbi:hypothetical protein B0H14DRAFT_2577336 [Mycena olivaceomarginata]|nr:hypothetical protein B0H14DRAFT_2577336 [Mycena olivaceomarginata]
MFPFGKHAAPGRPPTPSSIVAVSAAVLRTASPPASASQLMFPVLAGSIANALEIWFNSACNSVHGTSRGRICASIAHQDIAQILMYGKCILSDLSRPSSKPLDKRRTHPPYHSIEFLVVLCILLLYPSFLARFFVLAVLHLNHWLSPEFVKQFQPFASEIIFFFWYRPGKSMQRKWNNFHSNKCKKQGEGHKNKIMLLFLLLGNGSDTSLDDDYRPTKVSAPVADVSAHLQHFSAEYDIGCMKPSERLLRLMVEFLASLHQPSA